MFGFLKKLFGLSNEEEVSAISSRMSAWERTKKDKPDEPAPRPSAEAEQRLAEIHNFVESEQSIDSDTEAAVEKAKKLREMAERTAIDYEAMKEKASAEHKRPSQDKPIQPDYIEPEDEPSNPWSKKQ